MSEDDFERIRQAAPERWKVVSIAVRSGWITVRCELQGYGRKVISATVEGETVETVINAIELLLLTGAMLAMPDRVDVSVDLRYDRQGEDVDGEIRALATEMGVELPG